LPPCREVLFGRERFTAERAWQDLGPLLPGWEIVTSPPRLVAEHLDGVNAMCPSGAWIDRAAPQALSNRASTGATLGGSAGSSAIMKTGARRMAGRG